MVQLWTGFLIAILVASLFVAGSLGSANALIMPIEKSWAFNISWFWDPSIYKTVGLIQPKIVVTSANDTMIEGEIVDQNGTRLYFYGEESRVSAKFGFDWGYSGEWFTIKPQSGTFIVEVPEQFADADYVKIHVTQNSFAIARPPEEHAPQIPVLVNSATLVHDLSTKLPSVENETSVATAQPAAKTQYSSGSLIDLILSRQ